MILLPRPRRAALLSFWLGMSLCAGVLAGALLACLEVPRALNLGVLVGLGMALPGVACPAAINLPYRAWNKGARLFARAASFALLAIYFYVVLVAVGRGGTSLVLAPPSPRQSMWVPRGSLPTGAYVSQHAVAGNGRASKGGWWTVLAWGVRTGNVWACSLLPVLVLLASLESEAEQDFPAGIYTLF